MIPKLTVLLYTSLLIFSCNSTEPENKPKHSFDPVSSPQVTPLSSTIDYSTVELSLERGAFHYDKFVLKNKTITYYPEKEGQGPETAYQEISSKKITTDERDRFINHLLNENIWKMNDSYPELSSCTSSLVIDLKLGKRHKHIIADDFERSCPDLLQFIEKELVRLHGKGLKRIILPG